MGKFPGWVILALTPILIVQIALMIGLGVFLGIMNVFFRDVGQFVGIVLQFWFWFTPIVYPASVLPEYIQPWFRLNPMVSVVAAYQSILLYGQWPQWSASSCYSYSNQRLPVGNSFPYWRRAGEMVDEIWMTPANQNLGAYINDI